MCAFCELEKGNTDLLCIEFDEVKVGNKVLGENDILIAVTCKDDGTYELSSSYSIPGVGDIANVSMGIKYCPFCGRELPHEKLTISLE